MKNSKDSKTTSHFYRLKTGPTYTHASMDKEDALTSTQTITTQSTIQNHKNSALLPKKWTKSKNKELNAKTKSKTKEKLSNNKSKRNYARSNLKDGWKNKKKSGHKKMNKMLKKRSKSMFKKTSSMIQIRLITQKSLLSSHTKNWWNTIHKDCGGNSAYSKDL